MRVRRGEWEGERTEGGRLDRRKNEARSRWKTKRGKWNGGNGEEWEARC